MMKTYIASLLCILLAGAQLVRAQESMDDVLAQVDSANNNGATEAVAEPAPADTVDVEPAAVGSSMEIVEPVAVAYDGVDDELFQRGLALYEAKKYIEAENVFEAMLVVNPHDRRAMKYLTRTATQISSLEKRKQVATREQAFAEVDSAWNEEPKATIKITPDAKKEIDPDVIAAEQMTARVKSIMIPHLEFRDAHVKDVVLFLSEACRSIDPNGKGVNMLLLGVDDSFDAEGSSVTISTRDMSLFDALKYIAEMAKLKFEVRANVVAIMPVNYEPASAMLIRTYKVSPEVGDDLESAGGGGGDDGGDSLFGDDSFSSESASGPVDVAGYFTMVKFPDGSSATYHPSFQKLIVNNTVENLTDLEQIIDDMEDEAVRRRSQQVEIEAKFVEFNEGALEEIGFDWNIYGSGSAAGLTMKDGTYFSRTDGFATPRDPHDPNGIANANPTDVYVPDTAPSPLYTTPVSGFTEIADNGQNFFGNNYRNNMSAFESVTTGVLASMGGSPAAMVFGNDQIDLRITAMEQEGTADVLSAPKVTTKSGNEAIIRVAEVHRYPQDWDVETGQRTSPVVKPQDWEDFDLGVTLRVTPVVDADANTIDLDLQPEITKFKGFDEYKVGANAYESSGSDLGGAGVILGDGSALIVRMPYFEKRSVQTQVTIADGHTVLMGGLVDERTETFRDQVPILGDIPYLGRLFRTEGSRSAKKNLVIYVRATQVDDRGMSQKGREMARLTMAD